MATLAPAAADLTPNVVDLDPVSVRRRIEANKIVAEITAKVLTEQMRLSNRIDHVERKAKRLSIGNGKRTANAEVHRLKELREMLGAPPARTAVKLKPHPKARHHEHRAIDLYNELVGVA